MRCKMRLVELGKRHYFDSTPSETVAVFYPVQGDSPENKEFFQYTPSGRIELGVLNERVASQLELGADYYVDFTLAKQS